MLKQNSNYFEPPHLRKKHSLRTFSEKASSPWNVSRHGNGVPPFPEKYTLCSFLRYFNCFESVKCFRIVLNIGGLAWESYTCTNIYSLTHISAVLSFSIYYPSKRMSGGWNLLGQGGQRLRPICTQSSWDSKVVVRWQKGCWQKTCWDRRPCSCQVCSEGTESLHDFSSTFCLLCECTRICNRNVDKLLLMTHPSGFVTGKKWKL